MSKDTKDEIELRCIDCGETSVLSQTGNVSPEASAAAGKHDAAGVFLPGFACPTCGGSLVENA